MFRSQNFLAQEQHLQKTHPPDSEEYFAALAELITRHLRSFPESMTSDIMDYAIANSDDTESAVRLIADVIDLLWMQYDDHNDPFTHPQWEYIRDVTNEYALDLDMPLVQYIMERVVDHGAI